MWLSQRHNIMCTWWPYVWTIVCVWAKKGVAALVVVKLCDIAEQQVPNHVRTVQQGPQGRQNSTGVRKYLCEERVWCVWDPKNRETHGKTTYSTSPLGLGEWMGGKMLHQRYGQINIFHFTTHTHTHTRARCGLIVNISVPGHLYSFLACAMSPLLSLVRWPIAGRTPFSSLDGRMVSRNIPLQRGKERFHTRHALISRRSNTRFNLASKHCNQFMSREQFDHHANTNAPPMLCFVFSSNV